MRPAFERAVARYGNGAGTGRVVAADDIPAAVEAFIRVAEGTPWKQAGVPGIPARVAQDIELRRVGPRPGAHHRRARRVHPVHLERRRLQHHLGHEHGHATRERRRRLVHLQECPRGRAHRSMSRARLLATAGKQPAEYGFTGSPSADTKYYGYLVYADGY